MTFAQPGRTHNRSVNNFFDVTIPCDERSLIITIQKSCNHCVQRISHLVDVINIAEVPMCQIVVFGLQKSFPDKFIAHRVFPRATVKDVYF